MNKQVSVVLLGAGNRCNVYSEVSIKSPEKLKIVGIVDPERDKFADAVINGTMDHLHVQTRGEIKGTFEDSRYVLRKMEPNTSKGYYETLYDLKVEGDKIGATGGHGGGDYMIVYDFIDYINGKSPSISCATLEDSKISHLTVFKAEESRKTEKIIKMNY